MVNIKIKIMPANKGDCFLINFLDNKNINILIDSGYSDTYHKFLRNEIIKIQKKNESINLMVITHIDSDHISGAISFLDDNKNIKISIDEIWHNSLRHIYKGERANLIIEENDLKILNSIKMKGMKIPEDSEVMKNRKISGVQGTALGAHIRNNNYAWNIASNGKAICKDEIKKMYNINDVKIKLLSPTRERLDELGKEWKKELRRHKGFKGYIDDNDIFDDVFEMLMSHSFSNSIKKRNKLISGQLNLKSYLKEEEIVDEKASNCSSISFVMEYKGKKLLFLGDSNPNDIYNSITEIYKCDENNKVYFDAIKISHHGSAGNTTEKLMSIIDSQKFIISTNGRGKHKHPSISTIAKIVCRDIDFVCGNIDNKYGDGDVVRELIFNYKSVAKRFDNKNWMDKFKYKVNFVKENQIQELEI